MSGKRRECGAVPHVRIVRDPKSPYWYAEFEVDGERFHKSTRQRDEAAAEAVASGWYNQAVAALSIGRFRVVLDLRKRAMSGHGHDLVRAGTGPCQP